MKLVSVHVIQGKINLITGLHIGASKDTIEIGGLDQPIVKHPVTGEPYIPGSSIKGKMRSLLELAYFPDGITNGKPCSNPEKCPVICKLFGISGSEKKETVRLGPTRLIIRDAYLSPEYRQQFENGQLPMEEKYETAIDRISGTALGGSLRPIERVPSGVMFDFSFSLKVFEGDNEKELLEFILNGMRLIELDALGGQSSRGSGQVKFESVTLDGEEWDIPEKIFNG